MASQRNLEIAEKAFGSWLVEGGELADVRKGYDGMHPSLPKAVKTEARLVGGVPGLWLEPPEPEMGVILFFHGGGYTIGSSESHSELAARIALAARRPVFSADYRLVPEAPFPAAFEDGLSAYGGLLESGYQPSQVAIVGDSAGGGLTLATLLGAKSRQIPLPACAVTMSAWADMTCSGDAFTKNTTIDPLVTPQMALGMAEGYLAGQDGRNPFASPVFGDFSGLPPLLMQVGSDEILLDDTIRVAARAKAAGVDVTLTVEQDMIHVFQLLTWLLPESLKAIDEIGAFIRRHL